MCSKAAFYNKRDSWVKKYDKCDDTNCFCKKQPMGETYVPPFIFEVDEK